MDPSQIQWGTVADWLSGIGTVAAFAVTYWALRSEIRQRRRETQQRRVEHARQLRVELGTRTSWSGGTEWHVVVRNTSDQSFFEIVVRLEPSSGEPVETTIGDLLPHQRHEFEIAVDESSDGGEPTADLSAEYDDARGRRFVRDPSGIVRPSKDPTAG